MNTAVSRPRAGILLALVLTLTSVSAAAVGTTSQAGGGTAASGPRLRLLRVVSGSQGVETAGRFVIQDPRTVFSRDTDKEAIVYFEWEGDPGKHRFEGVWRNPAGDIEVITRFEYDAKDKLFAGFWKLPLNSTMAAGLWHLEARVDGEQAGSHAIDIRAESVSIAKIDVPVKRALTSAEAYGLLAQQTFRIEALDAQGRAISGGMGVVVSNLGLVTAFQAVDGATTARVTAPDGTTATLDSLVAWRRDQDIAVLPMPERGVPTTTLTLQPVHHVGDRVYTLALGQDGTRTLVDSTISGVKTVNGSAERVTLAYPITRGAAGAPVLNDAGEMIGLVGGAMTAGAATVRPTANDTLRDLLAYPDVALGGILVAALPANIERSTSLTDLLQQGVFTAPLDIERRHVVEGYAAQTVIQEKSGWVRAMGQNTVFSKNAGTFVVYVNLSAQTKLRTMGGFQLYDRDGKRVGESRPTKVNINRDQMAGFSWMLDAARLPAGFNRVDFVLNGLPIWRTFVEIQP